jgi:hypothetical protein
MRIFDVRGTHGSGKTTVAKAFVQGAERVEGRPLTYDGKTTTLGYYNDELNLFILGKYDTACGGCDGIKTQEEVKARINFWGTDHNILLEGILVAHTYEPWTQFAMGRDYQFIILNTPLEECIRRVDARRAAKGQGPLPNPKNIIRDHARICGKLPHLFRQDGHSVHVVSSEEAPIIIREMLA